GMDGRRGRQHHPFAHDGGRALEGEGRKEDIVVVRGVAGEDRDRRRAYSDEWTQVVQLVVLAEVPVWAALRVGWIGIAVVDAPDRQQSAIGRFTIVLTPCRRTHAGPIDLD